MSSGPIERDKVPASDGVEPSEVVQILARWLDNWLRIPGTRFKIGLDPLLAFFPGIGSTLASAGGLIIWIEALRSGVGGAVLLRMAGNLLANTLLDYLPVLGPVVSAFFKSNLRNLRLLQQWQRGQHQAVRASTRRRFLLLGLFLLALGGTLFGLGYFYVWLLRTYVL